MTDWRYLRRLKQSLEGVLPVLDFFVGLFEGGLLFVLALLEQFLALSRC